MYIFLRKSGFLNKHYYPPGSQLGQGKDGVFPQWLFTLCPFSKLALAVASHLKKMFLNAFEEEQL